MTDPLRKLQNLNLIVDLKQCGVNAQGRASTGFTYCSTAIRDCLSKEGNILEAKAWFSAQKLFYFDTIQANVSFRWEDPEISNELDLVLTKGFKTWICSCKTAKYDKDHIYEIDSLARHFSVNSIPVIIYTSDRAYGDNQRNVNVPLLIKRAENMGVRVITKEQVETNLGQALLDIAKS